MEEHKRSAFFSRAIHRVHSGVSRFAPVFVFSLLLYQSMAFGSRIPLVHILSATAISFAAVLAMVAAVNVRIFCEKKSLAHKQIYPWAAAAGTFAIFFGVFYCMLRSNADNLILLPTVLTCGLVLAGSAFAVWQLYGSENADSLFPDLFKNLLISGTACVITVIGITVCCLAVDMLLFSFPSQVLLELQLFSFYVLFPNMICAQLPKPNEKTTTPKAMHLLFGRVTFPLYLFLLCILCGYVGKILFTWKMPSGTMNWFASLALAGYLFFWLTLRQDNAPWVKKLLRWGWLVLIPILTVQMVGIVIRLRAYGLTTARYAGLLLLAVGVFGLVIAALNKHPRSLFLAFAGVILIGSCTPLNILDFPRYCQAKRLENVLVSYHLWDGKTLEIQPVSLSQPEQEQVHSSIQYLRQNQTKLMWEPALAAQVNQHTLDDWSLILDSDTLEYESPNKAYSLYGEEKNIPVTGYDKVCPFYWFGDGSTTTAPWQIQYHWSDGTQLNWNGEEWALSLIQNHPEQEGTLFEEERLFPISDTQALYLEWVNLSTAHGQIKTVSLQGYLLVKDSAES